MTAAETCRKKHWTVGAVLKKHNHSYTCAQILEIGKESIEVRVGAVDPDLPHEWLRKTTVRDLDGFKKIATAPLDDTPPRKELFQ